MQHILFMVWARFLLVHMSVSIYEHQCEYGLLVGGWGNMDVDADIWMWVQVGVWMWC